MVDFVFTSDMNSVSNSLWAVTSAVGAGLCFLVVVVIGAVLLHPKSRPCLDRVSFRIVTIALIANMIFGIASAVGGVTTHDGFLCGFSIFVLQLTLQISSFLLFCIALNLQLVVIHGLNGQNMEKFYITFSLVLSVILVVPPYAANQYGWDPLEQDSTQMAWTALAAIAEIVLSISVLLFLLKHRVRMNRVFVSSGSSNSPQVIHADRLRWIILRIALYPLASCFVNLLTIFTALHSTIADGIHNQTDYNILLMSDFLYGGRPIVYALLAASDPALVRGVKTLYQVFRGIYTPDSSIGKTNSQNQSDPVAVHIELTTIIDSEPSEYSSPAQTKINLADKTQHTNEVTSPEHSRSSLPQNDDGIGRNSQNFHKDLMQQEMAALNRMI
ncbi:hypothetical protein GYMLUDRAFT_264149 [Collybiopsis luxurians FD-317 M1]|uniref:Pheromone receptor n=1 Tax=Collybiopsis luxurians FD-317 M1 TaxID=944289 RepID=A0A0D0BKM1_9AGAR|nr:hypothetical protein GYMLUDRAFT_264149 [Collybiopsis luxurians FD-317 M1]